MADQGQIDRIAALLQETKPACLFQQVDRVKMGAGAVLHFVNTSQVPVTAGMIAEFMDVSTARVAVLLKKMESKNLLIRERDPNDRRVTIVRLSPQGEKTDAFLKRVMCRKIGEVIDKVGMERLLEFITVAEEIRAMFPESDASEIE